MKSSSFFVAFLENMNFKYSLSINNSFMYQQEQRRRFKLEATERKQKEKEETKKGTQDGTRPSVIFISIWIISAHTKK